MLKHLRPDSTLLRRLLLTSLLTLVILAPMYVKAVDTTYSLTLNIDPIGSGSVIANVTGPYNNGQAVLLNATGNPGWTFSAWSGDLTGTSNPTSITMNSSKTVTATFTKKSSTQLIQELIEEVEQYKDSRDIDNNGIANSLIVKLEAANAQLESGNTKAAGNILNAFINHVEAQHGKKNKHITEDAAHQLIEDAEYILSQL
jgi:uncharacterized repeat protein (TIGR02543 family)